MISGSGGYNFNGNGRLWTAEALHANGSQICWLTYLPAGREDHTMDGFTTCGGKGPDSWTKCYTLSGGQWTQSAQLMNRRFAHSSWSVNNQLYLLGGSGTNNVDSRTTSEIVTPGSSSTTEGFELKYNTR